MNQLELIEGETSGLKSADCLVRPVLCFVCPRMLRPILNLSDKDESEEKMFISFFLF